MFPELEGELHSIPFTHTWPVRSVPEDTMAFNGEMSPDAQQFPELWGSSRFSQRQDALESERTGDFHESQMQEEVPQENMEANNNLQNEHDSGNNIGDEAINKGEADQLSDKSADGDQHMLDAGAVSDAIKAGPPTWLSSAMLMRERTERALDAEDNDIDAAEKWCPVCSASGSQSCMCGMPMQAGDNTTMPFPNQSAYTHWLSMQGAMHTPHQHRGVELVDVKDADFGVPHPPIRTARTELNLSAAPHDSEGEKFPDLGNSVGGPGYADDYTAEWDGGRQKPPEWEIARDRALVISHPLYPDLLTAHAACLRVGTPVDQLPHIEAQLAQAHLITQKYSVLHPDQLDVTYEEKFELDHVMTQYTMQLTSFKDNLQQHVYNDVTEAMMSCWELEQALHTITGVSPGGGTGATMSDGDDDYDSDYGAYESSMDPQDSGGFGPLVPTESERTLMERVRQELKYELKQGYRARIEDVREEILRKRRAGKLPEGTTTVLKAWWQSHSKWPYPTEDEKERLIQETGLELKQVNNWFINQRKRNWHSNPLAATTDLKNKRKSW